MENVCLRPSRDRASWRPLRKPIALAQWDPSAARRDVFTTVMNWTSYDDVTWNGRSFGQKDKEFLRFVDLPLHVAPAYRACRELQDTPPRAACLGSPPPRDLLVEKGWRLVDPMQCCAGMDDYRRYIESSKGEWTVAKNAYVEGQDGLVQRPHRVLSGGGKAGHGSGHRLRAGPAGRRRHRDVYEIRRSRRRRAGRAADWPRHARAARAIAEEYFDAKR